jgi:hypothetical protein
LFGNDLRAKVRVVVFLRASIGHDLNLFGRPDAAPLARLGIRPKQWLQATERPILPFPDDLVS